MEENKMATKNEVQTEAHAYAIMLLTAPKFNHVDVHKIEHDKKECFYGVITSDGPSTKMFKYDPPVPVIEPDTIGWVTRPGGKELRVLHSQEGQKYIVYGPGQFRIGQTYEVYNFTPLTEKDLNIKMDDGDKNRIKELEKAINFTYDILSDKFEEYTSLGMLKQVNKIISKLEEVD